MNASTTDPRLAPRRFGLADGLLLMIALSISMERFRTVHWFESFPRDIAWCWEAIHQLTDFPFWQAWGPTRQQTLYGLITRLIDQLVLRTLCPILLGLMVAQPLLRLRQPRPPLRQVARQSGFVICLMGIALVLMLLPLGDMWFSAFALSLGLTRAVIVLMIWPIFGLAPWRSEPNWIDRLGRGVGYGWLVAIASMALLEGMGWN